MHLLKMLIFYWDDLPEYVAIDLKSGMQVGSIFKKGKDNSQYEVSRVEICDPSDILHMIGDEGYYDKGEPYTVPGGRIDSNRRRHYRSMHKECNDRHRRQALKRPLFWR